MVSCHKHSSARAVGLGLVQAFDLLNVLDQILDCAHLQPPSARKRDTRRRAHHARLFVQRLTLYGLAIVDNLTDRSSLSLPSQATEIDGSLGVTSADPDTARTRAQREYVARTDKALDCALGIGEQADSKGTIVGADSGGDRGVGGVDGDGVGGGARVLVLVDHLREGEALGKLRSDGRADQARGVADHEGHLLRSDGLGSDDEVALVLAVRIVEYDDEFAILCGKTDSGLVK